MLRRLTCTVATVGCAAAVASSAAPSSSPMVMARLPKGMRGPSKVFGDVPASLVSPGSVTGQLQRRCYSSRSDEKKSDVNKGKEAPAAAAAAAAASAVSATPATAATTAVHYFSSNEKDVDATSHPRSEMKQQEQAPAAAVDGGATAPSSIRTIGIKLSEDDELVRAFNNFSKGVNGCTQEEFLAGAKQAYYSLAVVISALVEHTKPLSGKTESTRTIAAAHEAVKLLDNLFKAEGCASAEAASAASQVLKVEEDNSDSSAHASSKTNLQESLVSSVVSAIVSLIPVSRHLAESIFKVWVMHKEKQVNLSSIASPGDYVLDSKLVIFARLGNARMYFNSNNVGAEVDVTFSNDYLRKLDPAGVAGSGGENGDNAAHTADNSNENDFDRGMIEVHTDTEANAHRTRAEEHTFVVNKTTRTLMPTGSTVSSTAVAGASASKAMHSGKYTTHPEAAGASAGDSAKSSDMMSRVQVTCAKLEDLSKKYVGATKTASSGEPVDGTVKTGVTEKATVAPKEGSAEGEEEHAVYIKVNGNMLPPIPASAHACALLTVDVVVPPERYAYNFEWFYKRIVGYENEYERIAAARVFASNSPKSLASFLDFFMRMVTGKPVEFLFSKAIGRMIGIPEDVSQTPPATRKLMCMYMDHSKKWVLADLITLAPVMETKLPKA